LPPPSQKPLAPHVDTAAAAQSLSGSVAIVTPPQVPLTPPFFAALHAWHEPAHAELQQKLSTQKPLPHWLATVHGVPVATE
jgi:hypothetical protein